jgi:anti-sigma-K factor RskA
MTYPRHDDVQELLAAYLLDAVDESERVLVEEHLLTCAECEREAASLTPTVQALAAAPAPVAPPARVRESVLDGQAHAAAPATRQQSPQELPAPDPATADDLVARRSSRATRRLSLLVAAAAVVALVMFLAVGPFRATPDVTTETVAAASDAQRFETQVGEATAILIVSRALDKVAIETRDMTPAPDGRDYQLWLRHPDGSVTDAGLMPREEDAAMVLPAGLGDAVAVAITVEPEGGSERPTGEPVAVIPVEA